LHGWRYGAVSSLWKGGRGKGNIRDAFVRHEGILKDNDGRHQPSKAAAFFYKGLGEVFKIINIMISWYLSK
jgi:hypothetical protein